ncbi:MAG: exo-alpha-sialidase [Chloroflexi bacterium]|nr:MAG: exo-alpha-sialidase [Chloroflexota bacterium]
MRKDRVLAASIPVFLATTFAMVPLQAGAGSARTQSNSDYVASYARYGVTNVSATTEKVSCYRPEVPFFTVGEVRGYTGMTACPGADTGEDIGTTPYPNQAGSVGGYPAPGPMLVNNHSESDLRVDPKNPLHIIGSSKWFASAEGYNHVLGFYESRDGGKTWPVQGHIPGYEGFTDNTDPVGAFDGYGNYYSLILPYQFAYYGGELGSGSKLYAKSKLPNAVMPAEAVTVAVRPAGATNQGQEPDKQWIAIDNHEFLPDGRSNPNYNTIYAMFVTFSFAGKMSKAYVSTAKALPGGHHTDWSAPQRLPSENASASDTYLLPHVDANGVVWTSITNFPSRMSRTIYSLGADFSTDGGKTWQGPRPVPGAQGVTIPPEAYDNTTFTDGIVNTFTIGTVKARGATSYPLYMSWEDYGTGHDNIFLSGSFDGGLNWSTPIQVNDNINRDVDEFQPNLAAAANGTVSVNFYDRRLTCPAASDADAAGAGLELDTINPRGGALPPYGRSNYCVDASVQFYTATLTPRGHNIRLSAHSWDPQLNAPWRYGSSLFSGKDTFIGDYFGNDFAGNVNLATSVSTYDDGANPQHYQQQIIASVAIP